MSDANYVFMNSTSENFIEFSQSQIWCQQLKKENSPTVVLLEGGPGSVSYTYPLNQLLSEHFQVIEFHPMGVGKSSAQETYCLDRILEELERVRSYYGIEKWGLCGHSWGCDLALLYQLKYPGRVSFSLALSSVGFNKNWKENYQQKRLERLGPHAREYFEKKKGLRNFKGIKWVQLKKIVNDELIKAEFYNPDFADSLSKSASFNFQMNFELSKQTESWRCQLSWKKVFQVLESPVYFVQGDSDLRGDETLKVLAEQLDLVSLIKINKAGHFPWIEQRENFEKVLLKIKEQIKELK